MKPVALITGGQQGIGLGIAKALTKAGFAVALASRSAEDDPAVVAALEILGGDARYFQHDLQNVAGVPDLLDRIEADLGPVTSLVSNAGVPAKVRGDMLDLALDSFDFVLGVNLRGTFFLAQEAARRMLALPADPYRSIVFVTSVSATHGVDRTRRILHLQGRRRDDGGTLRGEARPARHRRFRASARHHRDRHDRRGKGQIHRPDRRRAGARRPLGLSR